MNRCTMARKKRSLYRRALAQAVAAEMLAVLVVLVVWLVMVIYA